MQTELGEPVNAWVFRTFKTVVGALAAALPLFVLVRSVQRGSAELDGLWFLLAVFVCLPALIYVLGVSSKVGIVTVGIVLLLQTARTWVLYGSHTDESLRGLIPIIGVFPAIGIALIGLVGDLAYRFFANSSAGEPV